MPVTYRFASATGCHQRICGYGLVAVDAAVFNYRAILTSGAGCLARAFGLPILFPALLDAVDLGEPHPSVFRYHELLGDFPSLLEAALSLGLRHNEAADYRERSRWSAWPRSRRGSIVTPFTEVERHVLCECW